MGEGGLGTNYICHFGTICGVRRHLTTSRWCDIYPYSRVWLVIDCHCVLHQFVTLADFLFQQSEKIITGPTKLVISSRLVLLLHDCYWFCSRLDGLHCRRYPIAIGQYHIEVLEVPCVSGGGGGVAVSGIGKPISISAYLEGTVFQSYRYRPGIWFA